MVTPPLVALYAQYLQAKPKSVETIAGEDERNRCVHWFEAPRFEASFPGFWNAFVHTKLQLGKVVGILGNIMSSVAGGARLIAISEEKQDYRIESGLQFQCYDPRDVCHNLD